MYFLNQVYAEYIHRKEQCTPRKVQDVKDRILSKIFSCPSDRAAANKPVVEHLRREFNMEPILLNCNLHPLDGFANATRGALLRHDKEARLVPQAACYSPVSHFIYSFSRLR